MSVRSTKTVFTAGVIALVVAAGASVAGFDLSAQGEQAGQISIGTYQPQAVAQAVGLQEQVMQEMQGLQQRMQQAQQEGNQQAIQEIQAEAQQIQQDVADQFLADVEAVMPQVAEETGVAVIATDVSYTAPGVSTQDVTQDVIAALGVEPPAGAGSAEPGR